ncbi:MAG: endonuclease/exonuclease/phosphatase family protein [Aquisalinus sp.]|nr:endonuclease/exonuclease/phosphatase family protein [Aquisalinus sp.]
MKKLLVSGLCLLLAACGGTEESTPTLEERLAKPDGSLRIATFNVSLYRDKEGQLLEDVMRGDDPQIQAIADVILKVDPDILVLNEIDWHKDFIPLGVFRDNYLTAPPNEAGIKPLSWPFITMIPSNTGLNPGTADFDNNGEIVTEPGSPAYAADSFGYGKFTGQYGMAILSKKRILSEFSRSFKQFKWQDMPENLMPTDYYSEEAQEIFRLSSKNHVDIPVAVGNHELHLLMMHPTPPTFDGQEDRNGRRNHDEIRFFADYITIEKSEYIYDDAWLNTGGEKGLKGGLGEGRRFVILGDLNADPSDGDSIPGAIQQLLNHPAIVDAKPQSRGAWIAAAEQGGANDTHTGPHELDTADFRDDGNNAAGNLRIDYVLPSKFGLEVVNAGVYWPDSNEDGYDFVGSGYPQVSSDHRLVWVDVIVQD